MSGIKMWHHDNGSPVYIFEILLCKSYYVSLFVGWFIFNLLVGIRSRIDFIKKEEGSKDNLLPLQKIYKYNRTCLAWWRLTDWIYSDPNISVC